MGNIKFSFQTSKFDKNSFEQKIHGALSVARQESSLNFIQEMYKWFVSDPPDGHIWSGAAVATLQPLANAARMIGFQVPAPRPDKYGNLWYHSYWARLNIPEKDHPEWWAQHGPDEGAKFGHGTLLESRVGGDWNYWFEYSNDLFHFQLRNKGWDLYSRMSSRLSSTYAENLHSAIKSAFKTWPIIRITK